MLRIKPRKRYYVNILLVISMLVTAVVIVSSLVTMLNMHALSRDKIITEKRLHLSYIAKLTDETVVALLTDIANDVRVSSMGASDLKTLAVQGYRPDLKAARRLCASLQRIIAPHSGILLASVYFPAHDFLVSSAGFFTNPDRYDRNGFLKRVMADSPAVNAWTARRQLLHSGLSEQLITYTIHVPIRTGVLSDEAVFFIDASASLLSNYASIYTLGSEALFIHDDMGELLFSLSAGGIAGLDASLFAGDVALPEQLRLDGHDLLVTQAVSPQAGWTFTQLSSMNDVSASIKNVLTTYLLFTGAILVVALIGAYCLGGLLYRPVRQLLRNVSPEGALPAANELELIDQSFHRINTQLSKVNQEMCDVLWYALLNGPSDPERYHALLPQFPHENFYVLLLSPEKQARQQWIEGQLRERLGGAYTLEVVPMGNGLYAVILNTALDETQNAGRVRMAVEGMRLEKQMKCCAALGCGQESLLNVSLSYFQAKEALEYRYIQGADMFISYTQFLEQPYFNIPIPIEAIASHIRHGDAERAVRALDGFRQQLLTGEWSLRSVRYTVGTLFYALNNLVDQLKLRDNLPFYDLSSLYEKNGGNISGVVEELDAVRLLIENAAALIRDRSHTGQSTALNRIRAYIDAHLESDLSLSELSQVGGLNASYISSQFKKNYGIGVVQYINQQRLKKACELLTRTGLNIDEVSRNVGYQNTSYFIKLFNQSFDMTPNNYRLLHRGGEHPRG